MLKEPMPLINLTFAHGQTLKEARRRLEKAVHEVSSQFGGVRRVEWAADRNRVKLGESGFGSRCGSMLKTSMRPATIPILGELLGDPLASGLKQVVQQTFQKKLP